MATFAAEAVPAPSAKDLATQLSGLQQDGSSLVRLKLAVSPAGGGGKYAVQLQIKSRSTAASTALVYQVIWPKERAGESVLLTKTGNQSASGVRFTPPESEERLKSSQMDDPLFGSDLAYADVVENHFDWSNQTIVGTEMIGRANCQILESKPGKSGSIYSGVRSWIDLRRMVPLRIEKYQGSSAVVRRIETLDVVKDDKGRNVPANLLISSPHRGSSTKLEGSKLIHGVKFSDQEFTAQGLRVLPGAR